MTREEAVKHIFNELDKAEKKWPTWPTDKIHMTAILAEETGEAVQAALDCEYTGGDLQKLITELGHAGAMATRCLMHIGEKK